MRCGAGVSGGDGLSWLPFLGFARPRSPSTSSRSCFSSRSFQRRTCSWRILRNSVFFWSSLRAFSMSGSMYMSFRICCSMLAAERRDTDDGAAPGGAGRGKRRWPLTSSFSKVYSRMALEDIHVVLYQRIPRNKLFMIQWHTCCCTHTHTLNTHALSLALSLSHTHTHAHTHTQTHTHITPNPNPLCAVLTVSTAQISVSFVFRGHHWDNLRKRKNPKNNFVQTCRRSFRLFPHRLSSFLKMSAVYMCVLILPCFQIWNFPPVFPFWESTRLSCPSLHEYGRARARFLHWQNDSSLKWEEIPQQWSCFCHQWPTLPLPNTHPFTKPCSFLPWHSGSFF